MQDAQKVVPYVVRRLAVDPEFRVQFRESPAVALAGRGWSLTEEDIIVLTEAIDALAEKPDTSDHAEDDESFVRSYFTGLIGVRLIHSAMSE